MGNNAPKRHQGKYKHESASAQTQQQNKILYIHQNNKSKPFDEFNTLK